MSLLLAALQAHEEPAPLEAGDLLIYLAIIAGALFFVVLAGFGYFGTGSDDGSGE